jgi:GNAT superfamily N-acetyltransferase
MQIMVRKMLAKDAEAVNLLSAQLGYPLSPEQTSENIKAVLQSKKHIAFVAWHENRIVGWIGAAQTIMIEVMPHCEINGLVTDEQYRGKGVGKLLIEKVKQWAKENGNNVVSLHCNLTRTAAHLFYEHIGFRAIKEQKYFTIDI